MILCHENVVSAPKITFWSQVSGFWFQVQSRFMAEKRKAAIFSFDIRLGVIKEERWFSFIIENSRLNSISKEMVKKVKIIYEETLNWLNS